MPEAAGLQRALGRWYRVHGRHELPWRLTRDPYAVLVSEVMLQQTQVHRVLPYHTAWMQRWPAFQQLSDASPADVIRAWRGLGYNRRAVQLHRLAAAVVGDFGGHLPADPTELRSLPGVGPYTASALRCFARGERVAVADTNISRVLARVVLGVASQRALPPEELSAAAASLLPRRDTRGHNLALMDLGALVCTARSPRCNDCPLSGACAWRALGYPVPSAVAEPAPKFESTARFARGRIIDALREAPACEPELTAMLPPEHRAKLGTYLGALEREGLIVAAGAGGWSLPR